MYNFSLLIFLLDCSASFLPVLTLNQSLCMFVYSLWDFPHCCQSMQTLPEQPSKIYQTRLDEKKRLVIRNPQYTYYEVREFTDGHIELLPRVLASPDDVLSARTVKMMDTAVSHLNQGIVSSPVDTSLLFSLLDADERKEVEEARASAKGQA